MGIPHGCSFGYHAGGWGKPPVDEYGRPLYGDVFGTDPKSQEEMEVDTARINFRWGQIESDSESEESESASEEDSSGDDEKAAKSSDDEAEAPKTETPQQREKPKESGMETPASTPSGPPGGMETPDAIQLRKKREIEQAMEQREHKDLYKVIPEKRHKIGSSAMGSQHTYDLSKMRNDGTELNLTPDELAMDQDSIRRRMEQRMNAKQADEAGENDMSEMVQDHLRHTQKKRARQAARNNPDNQQDASKKQRRDFKF